MGTTEIVQALVSPAEKLIEAVSGAIGKAYEPKHIRKIAKRASSRLAYQEITKQQNIEAVVDNAYEELEHAENVSSESVNSDCLKLIQDNHNDFMVTAHNINSIGFVYATIFFIDKSSK